MIGIIVFIHISPLIIEDPQISTIIYQKNAKPTIKKLEKAVMLTVSIHIPHLKDFTILTSTKPTYVSNSAKRERLAKRESYARSSISSLN